MTVRDLQKQIRTVLETQLLLMWERKLDGLERGFISALRAFFTRQGREIVKIYRREERVYYDTAKWKRELAEIVAEHHTKAVHYGYRRFRTEAENGVVKAFDPGTADWDGILDNISFKALDVLGHLIVGIDETTRKEVARLVADYIEAGATVNDTAAAIAELFDKFKGARARLIARTETARAANFGYLETGKQLGFKSKRWLTALDEHVCPICGAMNGQVVPIDSSFVKIIDTPIQGGVSATLYKAEQPPIHPSCLPGDTYVSASYGVAAVTRRRYKGRFIIIRTESGHVLKVTPNHPILTPDRFVAAEALKEGDKIGIAGTGVREVAGIPQNDDQYAQIGEFFHALLEAGAVSPVSVPSAPEAFHGDGAGIDGEVGVIDVERFLRNWLQTRTFEELIDFLLERGFNLRFLFDAFRLFANLIDRTAAPANGGVGSFGAFTALFGRHFGHYGFLDDPSGQSLPSVLFEDSIDDAPAYPKLARDLRDGCFVDEVHFVNVIGVEVIETVSHVYNLESGFGYYIANGIITHNCRCTTIVMDYPVVDKPRQKPKPKPRIEGTSEKLKIDREEISRLLREHNINDNLDDRRNPLRKAWRKWKVGLQKHVREDLRSGIATGALLDDELKALNLLLSKAESGFTEPMWRGSVVPEWEEGKAAFIEGLKRGDEVVMDMRGWSVDSEIAKLFAGVAETRTRIGVVWHMIRPAANRAYPLDFLFPDLPMADEKEVLVLGDKYTVLGKTLLKYGYDSEGRKYPVYQIDLVPVDLAGDYL